LAEIALSRPALRLVAQGPARSLLRMGVFSLIVFGFISLFLIACARYFPTGISLTIFMLTTGVLLVLGWRRAVRLQSQLEYAVVSSLEDEVRSGARTAVEDAIHTMTRKHPWPVELLEVTVPVGGDVVGQTLRTLNLRGTTGVTVAAVQRDGVTHYDVPPDSPISPDDHLLLVAEGPQLVAAAELLGRRGSKKARAPEAPHKFSRVMMTAGSKLCGLTLRESGLRSTYGATVIGLQRGDERMTGPSPEECMHDGDLLLVMGPEDGIAALREALL
jgi:monovalent cation:H+ antiporter-2, CPA2 family